MGVFRIKGWRILATLVGCGLIVSGALASALKTGAMPRIVPEAGSEPLTAGVVTVNNAKVMAMNVTGQASPVSIRPSQYANNGFLSPQNAIDNNSASSSGGTWSRLCYIDCSGTTITTCAWLNFPAGYVPMELKVK